MNNKQKIVIDKDFNWNRVIKIKKTKLGSYVVFGKRVKNGFVGAFGIKVDGVKKFPKFELEIVDENEKKFLSFNDFKEVKKYPLSWLVVSRISADEKPEETQWEIILDENHYELIIKDKDEK